MSDVRPVVSIDEFYLDPEENPPPQGVKMYLLTKLGVGIIGTWDRESGHVGWRPFFRATPKMKEKINRGHV